MQQLNEQGLVELDAAEMAAVNGGDDPTAASTTLKPAGDDLFDAVMDALKKLITAPVIPESVDMLPPPP
jgi:hypothetical protein